MDSFNAPGPACRSKRWYVMRDLKRANAKKPAWKLLEELQFEVFTPMQWRVSVRRGKKVREQVPYMQDLLFVHAKSSELDPVVRRYSTLQYRYLRGGGYCEPMVVRDEEMTRFIRAVNGAESPAYFSFDEITPDMIGRRVRIVGGRLDGYECNLLKIKKTQRGVAGKHIIVELPGVIAASVEVEAEYVRLL